MLHFNGFQQLLYRKFLLERRWRVEEIAHQLNVGRSTMYAWIDGERTFPVDLVGLLSRVTGDHEFVEFVVRDTGFTLAPLPGAGMDIRHLESEALDVAKQAGRVVEAVQDAIVDGRVDTRDCASIRHAVDSLHREGQEVLIAAESATKEPPPSVALRAVK